MDEPFVPIEDVSKHFAVSISTVRAWIRQGLVPALKIGGVYRFKLSEVEQALRDLSCQTPKALAVANVEEPVQLELNFNPDDDL